MSIKIISLRKLAGMVAGIMVLPAVMGSQCGGGGATACFPPQVCAGGCGHCGNGQSPEPQQGPQPGDPCSPVGARSNGLVCTSTVASSGNSGFWQQP